MNKHLDSIMSCKEKSRKTFQRLFSFLDNGCYCLLKVCKEKSRKTFHRFFFFGRWMLLFIKSLLQSNLY